MEIVRNRFLVISIIILIVALVLSLRPVPARATLISWDFDYEFSDAYEPAGVAPWLNATFEDKGDGSVWLTMSDVNLSAGEDIKVWAFNFDPDLDLTKLDIDYVSDVAAVVSTGEDFYKADGDGKYDITFDFDGFGPDDTSVFKLTHPDGITASSFSFLSVPAGGHGPFYSVAHVGGIGPDDEFSGWIATIPDATTLVLLGSAMLGVGVFGRKKVFKRS